MACTKRCMNTLDITISCGLAPKQVSGINGGEYSSPCPICGGDDRFRVWPEEKGGGRFWCRRCGKKGDAIQLLIDAKGMTFKEACAHLGRALPARSRAKTPRAPKAPATDFVPREITSPAEIWQARASAFADYAHRELLKTPAQLAWLAARGITAETATGFNLGWNPKDIFREKPSWGVEDDGKKLWLPVGLVIPWRIEGRVHRLRVRRPEGEPRYLIVPGSGTAPMMIFDRNPEEGRGVFIIVESELDAILIAQEAGDLASVASLGNSAARPDASLLDALKSSVFILHALDSDAAGAKEWPKWREGFPQAERWPVPRGKDPGDYRKEGGDIRAWVLAGLPPGLRPAPYVREEKLPEAPKQPHELPASVIDNEAQPEAAYTAPRPIKTFKQKCKKCGVEEIIRVYYIPKGYCPDPLCVACRLKGAV